MRVFEILGIYAPRTFSKVPNIDGPALEGSVELWRVPWSSGRLRGALENSVEFFLECSVEVWRAPGSSGDVQGTLEISG